MSVLFREFTPGPGLVSNPTKPGAWWQRPSKRAHFAHSAVWACTRLRADVVSMLPVDLYRRSAAGPVEIPKPAVLVNPGGEQVDMLEWMYSTQSDLDTVGNAFGRIVEKTTQGLPKRIDLVPRDSVRVTAHKGEVTYFFSGKKVEPDMVWHERQYTASGTVVGLSPIAYASLTLQQHQSAQEFAAAWFGGGLIPSAHLKYGEAKVPAQESEAIKQRFMVAIENGEPFVTGKDWEYNAIDAAAAQASFIESMRFTDIEIGRFFGVPGDLFDAAVEGSSVTYANITQRNLQFLVMNLSAPIKRRENALTRMVPRPQYVKLNTKALLRMDPQTTSTMLGQQVKDRMIAPSEARARLEELPPLTSEQIAEFKELFPAQYPDKPSPIQQG